MKRFFKKPSGVVIEYDPSSHDLDSLKDRFKECTEGGGIKRAKPKSKKKN
tara:strand:- start:105 stop:254 length:150 start_codon:yes stop_codon:yes gene_type:complete